MAIKRLFIAEKPDIGRAIADELGNGISKGKHIVCGDDVVTWCFGHLMETAEPQAYDPKYVAWKMADLPIIPAEWKLVPKDDDAGRQLELIGKLMQDAQVVVNAGDPDRAGQALVDEVIEHHGWKKDVLRYWASARDPASVRKALADLRPNSEYHSWGLADVARSRGDWLVGMNLTRAYTCAARAAGVGMLVPVGRVQTAVLMMVYTRTHAIATFKPIPYHSLVATVQIGDTSISAGWRPKDDQEGMDAEGRLTGTAVADGLVRRLSGQPGRVSDYEQQQKTQTHPRTYSLTGITVAASSKWGAGADEVLAAMQALYERHKLTSYPRTDCDWLPVSQHSNAGNVLAGLQASFAGDATLSGLIERADPKIRSKTWDDSKITAHHGIVPTGCTDTPLSALSDLERKLFDLVTRAYLAQFYALHAYQQTVLTIEVDGESFVARGRVVTENGWKAVSAVEDDEEDKDSTALPVVSKGMAVTCSEVLRKDQKTKPPAAFTEGSLMEAMENIHRFVDSPDARKLLKEGDGIGTPATRSGILAELRKRGLLELTGKTLKPSNMAAAILQVLPPEVRSPVLTAQFEAALKEIQAGRGSVDAFVQQQVQMVTELVRRAAEKPLPLRPTQPKCPKCNKGFLFAGKGKDKAGNDRSYWQCGSDDCGHFCNDINGKPDLTVRPKCPKCNAHDLWRREGKAGYFWSCGGWKKEGGGCDARYEDVDGKPEYNPVTHTCPKCKTGRLGKFKGPHGLAWLCGRYKEGCRTSIPDLNGRPDVTKVS